MLSKAHLSLNPRMSGSRWMITPSWLSGSWRSFLYSSSVYSCHLFLISSASAIFPSSQGYGFFSSHVWMWELDYKESWAPKNYAKGNQSWILIGRTDAEALILWPPDAKNWLLGKDPDAGKDWRQEEKGTTEDEMAGWHHRMDGHEFEQALGVGDGQGGLACCGPRGRKVRTERLNWARRHTLQWEAYEVLFLGGSALSGLENFEHYFTSVWDEYNCAVVWAFFGIAFFWDWNENWPFPVLWPLLSFPNLLAYWVQHFHSITFQDLK